MQKTEEKKIAKWAQSYISVLASLPGSNTNAVNHANKLPQMTSLVRQMKHILKRSQLYWKTTYTDWRHI